jgi:hypothetical protein
MASSVKKILVIAKDRRGPKIEEGKWIVRFQYLKPRTTKPEWRTLVCTVNAPDHLLGLDLGRSGEYRKFLRERIVGDVEVIMTGI